MPAVQCCSALGGNASARRRHASTGMIGSGVWLLILGGLLCGASQALSAGLTLERDLGLKDGHRLCRYSNGQLVRLSSEARACPLFHEGPPAAATSAPPLPALGERQQGNVKRCVYSLPGTVPSKEIQVPRLAPCPSSGR